MRVVTVTVCLALAALLFSFMVAGQPADAMSLPRPTIARTVLATRPALLATVTPPSRSTVAAQMPTAVRTLLAVTPRVTVQNVTPVSQYDSAQLITTFASQYLGINVTVSKAGGRSASVQLPSLAQAEMNEAVAVAGQAVVGVIAAGSAPGIAQVAVGSGSISGDINADLSGASAGAYALMLRTAAPKNADAALSLIRTTFPALASIAFTPAASAQGGYIFYATTKHAGIDWQTRKATTVAEGVMAGTTKQGATTLVWAVIGNGTFAASIVQ